MSTPIPPEDGNHPGNVPVPPPPGATVNGAPGGPIPPGAAPAAPAPHQRTATEALADRLDDDSFFSSLFDVTFTKFVTRKLAGPVYIVGLTLIALGVVLGLVNSVADAVATQSIWGVFLFLLGLLLTVVGGLLSVLLLRVAIEVFVAVVAIAENTSPRKKKEDTSANN